MKNNKHIEENDNYVIIKESDRKRVLVKISYIKERYNLTLDNLYFDENLKAICDKEGNIYWE